MSTLHRARLVAAVTAAITVLAAASAIASTVPPTEPISADTVADSKAGLLWFINEHIADPATIDAPCPLITLNDFDEALAPFDLEANPFDPLVVRLEPAPGPETTPDELPGTTAGVSVAVVSIAAVRCGAGPGVVALEAAVLDGVATFDTYVEWLAGPDVDVQEVSLDGHIVEQATASGDDERSQVAAINVDGLVVALSMDGSTPAAPSPAALATLLQHIAPTVIGNLALLAERW